METSTVWWLLTGAFVALELATGTFYLLMLALGMMAGALATHAGLGLSMQLACSALMGGGAAIAWYGYRHRLGRTTVATTQNPDIHIDIGSLVEVLEWSALGGTSVMHRGATWSARHSQPRLQDGVPLQDGWHRIIAVDGNTLVLSKV